LKLRWRWGWLSGQWGEKKWSSAAEKGSRGSVGVVAGEGLLLTG